MRVRFIPATLFLCTICLVGCDDIGKNEALTRGVLLVDSVGQEDHTVEISPDLDVTDSSGEYLIPSASTGMQMVEILSPPFEDPMNPGEMITESCLIIDVEIVKPITVLQFNLVREMNGDISGTANTLTNLDDAEIPIAPFAPDPNCF